MKQKDFESWFERIKEQEEKYGVEIHFGIEDCRDKDHLDCTWYGGEVGTIKMKDGWVITIGAYGDIRLGGLVNGEEFYFKDKNNSGDAYYEFGRDIDDKRLYELLDSENEQDYLTFENNNWFEVDLLSPDGQWVDLCGADNVLPNNILDCFEDVSGYFDFIDWAKN